MIILKMASSRRTYISAPSVVTLSKDVRKFIHRPDKNNSPGSLHNSLDQSSNGKSSGKSENTNSNESGGYLERKVQQKQYDNVQLKPEAAKGKTMITYSRQRPSLLELSKLEHDNFQRRTALLRLEIMNDRMLYRELADRLAEAKLSLAGLDPSRGKRSTEFKDAGKHDPGPKRPGRVSFLSVGRRVANVIRFRQAAQPRKPGMAKETSSVETSTLPKTPRFSSYMSPAAQYALMKGYEDIIFEKLSSKYPECTGMLKRNKTPHHSIAISDEPTFDNPELKLTNDDLENHGRPIENSLNDKNILSEERERVPEITSSSGSRSSSRDLPEFKSQLYVSRKLESDGRNEEMETRQNSPESFTDTAFQSSSLPHTNRISTFSSNLFNDDETMKKLSKYGIRDTSYQSVLEIRNVAARKPLGRNRMIHLSYRIENAMDILDTMKAKSEHALSPRVKVHSRRTIAPLSDFNRWTDQWTNEFNHDVVK